VRWIAAIALAGCASTTALDLELLPSPDLNSVDDLTSRLRAIIVIIDAASGRLYPLDAMQLGGDLEIKDADDDPGDLELVATVPMPADRLPYIRIERGGLPDVALHIRVLGSAADETGTEMARGGATGVTFVDGEITTVATPFNLLPRFLPLMVTEVAPNDGDLVSCQDKLDILTVFSRPVDAATITASTLTVTDLAAGDIAPEQVSVASSSVTFVPTRSTLAYRLAISTDVTDTLGAHLDQVPSMPDLQPFSQEFHLGCNGTMNPGMPQCSPATPTAPCPGAPGRFRCDQGVCVPASCAAAACQPGFACDPTTLACEVDCRLYGAEACPTDRPVCSEAGYCASKPAS
jgi:hypothetical protein